MTRPVFVRPAAERDLADARAWYERKRAGLGNEFLNEIASALRELGHNPAQERLYFGDFRRALLRRFPYKVFYQIIEDRVVVFRVLHAKQEHERGLASP